MSIRNLLLGLGCSGLLWGCGREAPPAPATPSPAAANSAGTLTPSPAASPPDSAAAPTPAPAPLPRIALGGGSGSGTSTTGGGTEGSGTTARFTRDDVLAALKPMQILRDEWNAVRQRSVGTQDAGEKQIWIWDHRTNPRQPALVMTSPDGKYFTQARLTFDPPTGQFHLQTTDPQDRQRTFVGTFSEPVQEVQMGDEKVHRVFKLQLLEQQPQEEKDQWQVVLNQQENNRYLLQLYRKRGGAFQPFETIAAQRQGTSFALSDTDYGERTCIISGGLGTMAVSFQGKTYWVCCTGCRAAFEEEPARWIAEFEAKQKK
jgi:hypothetical protein